jgi:hypothetical protein
MVDRRVEVRVVADDHRHVKLGAAWRPEEPRRRSATRVQNMERHAKLKHRVGPDLSAFAMKR